MTRAVARARTAVEADLPVLLELFDGLLDAGTRAGTASRAVGGPIVDHRSEAEARYRAALSDPDSRMVVAVVDEPESARSAANGSAGAGLSGAGLSGAGLSGAGLSGAVEGERIVGMVLCSITGSGTFVDMPIVSMNHFFVLPAARRCGAGRALVAAATAWAEARGLDGLGVAVYPDSREANRYFARLGFAPVYVHRVAPLAGLKRVLGAAVPAAAREESAHGARRRRRVGITGTRTLGRTRRYPA